MIRKDMKLATKNIESGIIFALPVFLAIIMYTMMVFWHGAIRSTTVLMVLGYASFFAGISVLSVMMLDTQGASIHAGLPLSTMVVLRAKVTIALVVYLFGLGLLCIIIIAAQNLITPLLIFIPLAQIPAGYSVPMVVGGVVYRTRGAGHVVAVNLNAEPATVLNSLSLPASWGWCLYWHTGSL